WNSPASSTTHRWRDPTAEQGAHVTAAAATPTTRHPHQAPPAGDAAASATRHSSPHNRQSMDQSLINRIVAAALLASSQPLTVVQLNGLFPLDEPAPDGSVQAALEALQAQCADRGVELVEVASGWRYQVKADVHAWVARLWT